MCFGLLSSHKWCFWLLKTEDYANLSLCIYMWTMKMEILSFQIKGVHLYLLLWCQTVHRVFVCGLLIGISSQFGLNFHLMLWHGLGLNNNWKNPRVNADWEQWRGRPDSMYGGETGGGQETGEGNQAEMRWNFQNKTQEKISCQQPKPHTHDTCTVKSQGSKIKQIKIKEKNKKPRP